jgi:hypothetical protein
MSIEWWLINRNGMPQSEFFVVIRILLLDFGLFIGGPWTKAGGVQPDDWPEWMRGFKDY